VEFVTIASLAGKLATSGMLVLVEFLFGYAAR
jgi:hypothetical protein